MAASTAALGASRGAFLRTSRIRPLHVRSIPSHAPRWVATSASGGKSRKPKDQSAYYETVNLPQTAFEQRANAPKREPEIQKFWAENSIYEELSRNNGGDKFVLHDGPPFANGPLHCGHALNKILKDFVNRYQLMRGRKAVYVPGWDTHGLPIELKVLQSMKSKQRSSLTTLDLRKRAKEFATETVEKHIAGFRRFGIWADWENPYLTLQPEYEAAQIEVFSKMYEKGFVFRGRKPVHWSPSSRTALAEAELEYPENHVSRSCYCVFPVTSVPHQAPSAVKEAAERGLVLSIWTTTPWTIPSNRAVAVNEELDYALVEGIQKDGRGVIAIAKDLVATVAAKLGTDETTKVVTVVKGKDLVGIEYKHPLQKGLTCRVVVGGDYITTETGTGLVHTAPGHGYEDYQTGLREGLELASPVDDAGKFTAEAANGEFAGLAVLKEGNEAVLEALASNNMLLLEEKYKHKYPYDWRTKKPTIFRATEQWFISLDGFRDDVIGEIENVKWYPESGINRIRSMVSGRGDWCISRQRTWGVPIPVFYDDETGKSLMNAEIVSYVKNIVASRGSDAWWELEADELLPESYRGRNLRKGRDTMDVWFDSGSSWAAVAALRKELKYPADIYLEGSDQHRGWFQSSILTSVATRGKAPYEKVLTHGFVLDQNGVKMSKSIGNVIDPMSIIDGGNNKKTEPAYGSDILRLWVSSVDYSVDVMIGKDIMKQVFDVYRKLRNTARYMVGNIHDFDPATDAVPYELLPSLDKYMLSKMVALSKEVEESYESFAFFRVFQAMQRFAVVELSNFYLDIAKDRLYISEMDSIRRRSCQTVVAHVVESFARSLAPILPHMSEDLWQKLPYKPVSNNESFPSPVSIFQSGWAEIRQEWENVDPEVITTWNVVLDARDAVNKVLEAARVGKTLGASMEAAVTIFAPNVSDTEALKSLLYCDNSVDELRRAFIVSNVEIADSADSIQQCIHSNVSEDAEQPRFVVGIDRHEAPKCDRCWHYDSSVGQSSAHPLLCDRCTVAVEHLGMQSATAAHATAVL